MYCENLSTVKFKKKNIIYVSKVEKLFTHPNNGRLLREIGSKLEHLRRKMFRHWSEYKWLLDREIVLF